MPSGCKHACLWLAHQQPFSDPDISLSHVSTLSLNLLRPRISSSHSLFAGPCLPFRPTQRPWTDLTSSFLAPKTQSRSPGVTLKYPRPHLHQIGQLWQPLRSRNSISAPSLLNPQTTKPPLPRSTNPHQETFSDSPYRPPACLLFPATPHPEPLLFPTRRAPGKPFRASLDHGCLARLLFPWPNGRGR